MKNLRKVLLVQLPSGVINLIPLEEIIDCKIITPDEKTDFWVHEKTIPGGADFGLGENNKIRDLSKEDIKDILTKGGECFVEVDNFNKLAMPSNQIGYQKVVIHLICIEDEFEEKNKLINSILDKIYPFEGCMDEKTKKRVDNDRQLLVIRAGWGSLSIEELRAKAKAKEKEKEVT